MVPAEQLRRQEVKEEILKGYYKHRRQTQMTPSQQIATFEEMQQKKKTKKKDDEALKYAVRRGKHLFVKRGGAQYVDALTEGISVTEAAVKIQSAYRSRKARQVVKQKKVRNEGWSEAKPTNRPPEIINKPPIRSVTSQYLCGA